MDTATFRILETLSSNIGESLSINQLTERIKADYGTAYYANTYQKLQVLKKEGIIKIEATGNSSIVKFNLQSYRLVDALAAMEIEKKTSSLSNREDLYTLFGALDTVFNNTPALKSAIAVKATDTIKLNRIDLILLLGKNPDNHKATIALYREIFNVQNKYNVKINNLILDKKSLSDLSTSTEINPLREAFRDKTILFGPQAFWFQIKEIAQTATIQTIKQETKPASIPTSDLMYNLNRFGYKEFGHRIIQGRDFCIEYVVTAILLQEDARLTEAIPIVIAKNNLNPNLLAFLSQKYNTAGKLLGLLKALNKIKTTHDVTETVELLELLTPEVIPAEQDMITEKLRLYNAL